MALTRVWIPSGNYSGGSAKRLIVIHTMEGFTGPNGAYDCAKYFQGDVGASSQVCIDNNRGKIWECVSRSYGSWTQCNYNSVSVSAEQSGYASWSRDYWLSNRSNQLHNLADWIAEESSKLGIPIVDLSSSAAQGSGRGVCYHSELGGAGCGHSDPGSGFPLDQVLQWAKGGGTSPQEGADVTAAVTFWGKNSDAYYACIGTDNRVYYDGPDTKSWTMVDEASNAKSGCSIAINPDGKVVIIYTNHGGDVCTYERQPGGGKWSWVNRGGNAR